jgi:hypothetical protein
MQYGIEIINAGNSMVDNKRKPDLTNESNEGPSSDQGPDPGLDNTSFDIEWTDEEIVSGGGTLFSEPGPEPPLQSFEILGWSRPGETAGAEMPDQQDTDLPSGSPYSSVESNHPSPAALGRPPIQSPRSAETPGQIRAVSGTDHRTVPRRRPSILIRLVWSFMPIILFTAGYAAVFLTQDNVGYAWDEAYYYEPSLLAAEWLAGFLKGGNRDSASIDRYWSSLREHPSVLKLSAGISLMFFPVFFPANFPGEQSHLMLIRLPVAIYFGISLSLVYLLGRRAWGPVPGLISALLLLTMPRVFGHAHFASMEVPLICIMLAVVFCFLRGLDSRFWALLTGICFGFLLATKINAFFLPVPLLLWAHLYAKTRYLNNLLFMLILGPLVMILVWPWLWHDPLNRILEYLAFHVNHQQTALYFQNVKWGCGGVSAPWYYPLVMIFVSLPSTHILLMVVGIIRNIWKPHHRPYSSLFLMCILFMLLIASLSSTPKYDGVRLFLPVFPFLALVGGGGSLTLIRFLTRLTKRYFLDKPERQHRLMQLVAGTIAVAILLSGSLAMIRIHPYYLSYFNRMTGGLPGAADKGFEITYWGEAFNKDVNGFLNTLPINPDGSKPKILVRALHRLCMDHLQQWGYLSDELLFIDPGQGIADYHVLLMRKGFWSVDDWILEKYLTPLREWRSNGISMISVYRTGPEFERFRIQQKTLMSSK